MSRVAGRRRWPTIEEVEPVIARLPGDLEKFARVALWSGLRLSEVAALRRSDVEYNTDGTALLHVREGKGNVEGWSLLYEPGRQAIDAMLGYSHERVLLVNSQRQPWNRRSVNKQWVHARSLVAGQESTKFHTLRAIHATWLLDQGVAELDVAMQLRHIDKDGHPNVELVRKVYGKPSVDAAMDRLRLVGERTIDLTPGQMVASPRPFLRELAEVPPPKGMSQAEWDAIVAEVRLTSEGPLQPRPHIAR